MKLICTLQTVEEYFSAAAFAEANEHQTARELLQRHEAGMKKTACAVSVSDEKRLRAAAPTAA